MNKEQVKEAIKVMEHWLNGGEVEFNSRYGGGWLSPQCGVPSWNWQEFYYRIKKEPLEVWVAVLGDTAISFFNSKKCAEDYIQGRVDEDKWRVIKLVEVAGESK